MTHNFFLRGKKQPMILGPFGKKTITQYIGQNSANLVTLLRHTKTFSAFKHRSPCSSRGPSMFCYMRILIFLLCADAQFVFTQNLKKNLCTLFKFSFTIVHIIHVIHTTHSYVVNSGFRRETVIYFINIECTMTHTCTLGIGLITWVFLISKRTRLLAALYFLQRWRCNSRLRICSWSKNNTIIIKISISHWKLAQLVNECYNDWRLDNAHCSVFRSKSKSKMSKVKSKCQQSVSKFNMLKVKMSKYNLSKVKMLKYVDMSKVKNVK
jgi:hypothetical protein